MNSSYFQLYRVMIYTHATFYSFLINSRYEKYKSHTCMIALLYKLFVQSPVNISESLRFIKKQEMAVVCAIW